MSTNKSEEMAMRILQCRIPFRDYQMAFDAVIKVRTRAKTYRQSQGITIKGPSGSAKSTLCKAIASKFPHIEHAQYTEREVVIASIPPKPSPIAMAKALLDAMGGYYSKKAVSHELNGTLIKLFAECRTLVLMIDESQELVERGTKKQHMELADWFKWLMNETGVSIVLLGLPYLTNIFKVNSQLRRRFSESYDLKGWRLDNSEEMDEFQNVVYTLVSESGYPGSLDILLDNKFLESLQFATNGTIAHMVTVVAEAVRLAADSNSRALNTKHFETAFITKIWHDVTAKRNPFSSKFNREPLTKYGEPFAEESL